MLENTFQAHLIGEIRKMFGEDKCFILKNDSAYLQGVPDLLVLVGKRWAMLEVKPSADAPYQPNQEYYLELLGEWSFTATIYPENEREVLRALQSALKPRRAARVSVP